MNSKLIKRLSSEFIYGRRKSSRRSSGGSDISEKIRNILSDTEKKELDEQIQMVNNNWDPKNHLFDPDFFFDEARRLFKLAMTNKLDECLLECDLNMFKSPFYPFLKGSIIALLSVSSLDRELIQQGIEAFRIAAEMAYQTKRKRSWKNVLFRPDYNAFTDEEILSEVMYCGAVGCIGGLTLLSDKSYKGLLSAAVHFNKSYKLYFDALNIVKYRKKWEYEVCRVQFTTGVKLGLGITNLVFSFAPTKLAKFLQFVGFPSNLEKALGELHEIADSGDALVYLPSAMTLLLYYGLLEPVYGVGEVRKDLIVDLAENFLKFDIYGGLNYFVLGARELVLGNIEESIKYELHTRDSLAYFGNTTVVISVFNLLNYTLSGQWRKLIECIETLNALKVKAYLPSFVVYIHAAALRLIMDEEGRPELEEVISEKLHEVKHCRGFFVLKKVFYEQMLAHRAAQFCNNVKAWSLPFLEILYVGNFIYCIEGQPKYINPFLEKVQDKLDTLAKNDSDYWDKYGYLLFLKAFLLKLRGDAEEESLQLFHEILSLESVIESEVQVIPQTCYEIGLIHRKRKNQTEAKRWLNKASKYSSYMTEFLIKWRVSYALDHPNPMEYEVPKTITYLPIP
ncbi:Tetratricopeptide repeat protein 39A [Halotydeus destructor]|nr:Tetratricopeptide repeat protein 39A [Halotydeus destructor]